MNLISKYLKNILFFISMLLLTSFCTTTNQKSVSDQEAIKKITFDLQMFNDDGLYGEPDGLVALDYKFCIPFNDEYKNEVASIDTTISFHKGTGIRNGCSANEYLCIGNTHQKGFKDILLQLASLDYIDRIEQMFWEK
jgi:hypothetical protein